MPSRRDLFVLLVMLERVELTEEEPVLSMCVVWIQTVNGATSLGMADSDAMFISHIA